MAKREAKVDDDDEQRAVFVDTSLDTHLVLLVSPTDTFSLLKQKILVEHPKCFPDFVDIKINALKVKRRGCYYHLLDSMLVRTAFYGITKNWFLRADVSSQTPSSVIPIEPSKALPPPVATSNILESGVDRNEDDHVGKYPSDANKMLGLEIPNNFDVSGVHIECKAVEETLNAGDLQDSSDKKNTKKRKRRGQQDGTRDEKGQRLESVNHVGKELPSTENELRNVGNDMKLINNVSDETSPSARARKRHRVVNKDVQETSLLKTKSFISDSNRADTESEAAVRKNDQGDMQRSASMDVNGERLESVNDVGKEPPSTENDMMNVGNDTKLKNNVADEASPFAHTEKNPEVVNEDAEEISLSKIKSFVTDSNRVNPESEDAGSKSDQGDVQRIASVDVNGLAPSGTSKGIRKRKKGKKYASYGLHSSEVNKEENLMQIEDHAHNASASATEIVAELEGLTVQGTSVQSSALLLEDGDTNLAKDVEEGTVYKAEGISVSLDKLVNVEIKNNKIGVTLESEAKKTKKAKKGDVNGVAKSNCTSKMPDAPKNGCASTLNENTIHGQEDSVTGSMELGTRSKKKKVKKGTRDIYKEAEDAGKIGVEPTHTTEIKNPYVSTKIRGEKVIRKAQKKQIVSGMDTTEVSVQEQSDEKMSETDVQKLANVVPLGNDDVEGAKNLMELTGDLHEDISKTPPTEVSADVTEVQKTDRPRASKRKVKKHDVPSSIDTSCSGQNMVASKNSRGSERTADDCTGLKVGDEEAGSMRGLHAEPVHPPPINKDEDNMEISSDKPKKRGEKKQTALKEPPKSPMKQQFDEKTREMALPISTDEHPLAHAVGNDADHQQGLSLMEDHNENLKGIPPSDSASLADVRNWEKPHASKEDVKKLDLSSSMDTSSNQTSLSKSKKSKVSKRAFKNGAQLQESVTEQHSDISLTQPSQKHSGTPSKIEPHAPLYNGNNSVAKLASLDWNAGARKSGTPGASLHDGSKLPGASSTGSPVRKTRQVKKANELQKKPDEYHLGSKGSSLKNTGEVVNTSAQKKGLLATPGAIFEDGSSGSSDDEDKLEGSTSSTRTPSDNLSSSDYSEGESKGDVVTSRHDASKGGGPNGTNANLSGIKNMTLHSILRSSSRYRKAKVVASQSQLEDSEPVDFVPDSQGNL